MPRRIRARNSSAVASRLGLGPGLAEEDSSSGVGDGGGVEDCDVDGGAAEGSLSSWQAVSERQATTVSESTRRFGRDTPRP
jgi:hypothetical protein